MGVNLAIVGNEGTGKTHAARTLPPKETFFVKPNKKDLSFSGWESSYSYMSKDNPKGNMYQTSILKGNNTKENYGLNNIITYVNDKRPEIKYLFLDDLTHFFTEATTTTTFTRNNDRSKWQTFAVEVYEVLIKPILVEKSLRDDLNVIFCFHPQPNTLKEGELTIAIPGKQSHYKTRIPSYFTYVLYSVVGDIEDYPDKKDRYKFITEHDGYHPAKSSDAFDETYIPNDLKFVFESIEKNKKKAKTETVSA